MIRKERKAYGLLFFLVFTPCVCLAQTSNNGMISIKEGTVLSSVEAFRNNIGAELINDGDLSLFGGLNNDGTMGFTSGKLSGMTRFAPVNGLSFISGTGDLNLCNVEFNDPLGGVFGLALEMSVSGKAYFQKGIVNYNNAGKLVFENNATAENADNESYVEGVVVKNGNTDFNFPVGNQGKYRPVKMSAPNESDASFYAGYFFGLPTSLYPPSSVDPSVAMVNDAEYWVVKRTDSGSSNVFLTLNWDEQTTPSALLVEPYEDIHVVRWDEEQKLWRDEGGIVDSSKKEVITVSESLGSYGVFTLARVVSGSKTVSALHPGISPNGDGLNDELIINGLDAYPDNRVAVYDRFGKVVFETTSYNTKGNVFKGFLNEKNNVILPLGTYFYTVDYLDQSTGKRVKKSNYLYINLR